MRLASSLRNWTAFEDLNTIASDASHIFPHPKIVLAKRTSHSRRKLGREASCPWSELIRNSVDGFLCVAFPEVIQHPLVSRMSQELHPSCGVKTTSPPMKHLPIILYEPSISCCAAPGTLTSRCMLILPQIQQISCFKEPCNPNWCLPGGCHRDSCRLRKY